MAENGGHIGEVRVGTFLTETGDMRISNNWWLSEFVKSGDELCRALESDIVDPIGWSMSMCKTVSRVIAAAYQLPIIENAVDAVDDEDIDAISREEWRQVYERVSKAFRERTCYWTFLQSDSDEDRVAGKGELVSGSLGDDLADIYDALKPILSVWRRQPELLNDSLVNSIRDSFEATWWIDASAALRILHRIGFGIKGPL